MSALSRTILVTTLAAGCALAVSACGQKGDLYLPPPVAGARPVTVPAPAPTSLPATAPASAPAVRP